MSVIGEPIATKFPALGLLAASYMALEVYLTKHGKYNLYKNAHADWNRLYDVGTELARQPYANEEFTVDKFDIKLRSLQESIERSLESQRGVEFLIGDHELDERFAPEDYVKWDTMYPESHL